MSARFLTIALHSVTLKANDIIIDAEIQYVMQEEGMMSYLPIMRSTLMVPPELLPAGKLFEEMSVIDWTNIISELFTLKFISIGAKPIDVPRELPPGETREKYKQIMQGQIKKEYREMRLKQYADLYSIRWAEEENGK